MATLVALLGGLVLFTAGAKIGHFILLGGAAVLLVFHQIRDAQYRLARLVTFLNPGDETTEAGFQIHQSLVGIGSGGIFGTGFGQGQQKLGYLPYAYSDFLFSTIGEEWGFLGVLVVVVAVRALLLARVPDRPHRGGSVRPVSRGRTHRRDRAHGVHAHGGVARPDAHDRAHAAVHVVRPVEPGDLAARDRHPDQHRALARAGRGRRGGRAEEPEASRADAGDVTGGPSSSPAAAPAAT